VTDAITSRTRLALVTALVLGVVSASAVSPAARAAEPRDPIQREDVALIEKQLQRIDPVINRLAKRQHQQAGRRVILDIDRLRADVNDIRNGLRAYLAPPRLPPRQPASLSGKYLSQRPAAKQ
jgi:RAQPRD family integrative conjugative element protein